MSTCYDVKKEEGEENMPFKPKKEGHRMECVSFHETKDVDLDERRMRASDVQGVDGSRRHFHFRFLREGVLAMRFLSCMCSQCKVKDWGGCLNKKFVGKWEEREIGQLDARGVRANEGERKEMAHKVGKGVSKGDVVAVFTKVDDQKHRFWLAKAKIIRITTYPNQVLIKL